MQSDQRKLESLLRWKKSALWAPVAVTPLLVYWLLTDRTILAIGLGFAALIFVGVARSVVLLSSCPSCGTRFRDTPAGSRRVWDELACATCNLSLFELRRGRARD